MSQISLDLIDSITKQDYVKLYDVRIVKNDLRLDKYVHRHLHLDKLFEAQSTLFYGPSHSSKHDNTPKAVLDYNLQSGLEQPASHDSKLVSSVPGIPYNKANKTPSINNSPTLYTVFLEDNHLLSPRQHISLKSKPYLLSCNYTKGALPQYNSSSENRA